LKTLISFWRSYGTYRTSNSRPTLCPPYFSMFSQGISVAPHPVGGMPYIKFGLYNLFLVENSKIEYRRLKISVLDSLHHV
jgi:hypothetical protein